MALFWFSLQNNDSYAFRKYPRLTEYQQVHQGLVPDLSGATHAGLQRCQVCGELLHKWDEPLAGLVVKKRRYDIGITYDGVEVVSRRFKSVYEETALAGLVFRQLPNDPEFFSIRASRAVVFDAARRGTSFENACPVCGRFESVIGATPPFLEAGTEVGEREFVRTDLEFASNDEKSPLLICGGFAAQSLSAAKLRGLDLVAIKPVGTRR
jgi:hypothetical protein